MRLRTKVNAAVAAGLVLGGLTLPTATSAADANIVYGWGENYAGQTGAPASVEAGPMPINLFATDATQVSAGDTFSVALRADGTVWAWGDNHLGQLGNDDPTVTSTNTPVQVHGLPAAIVQVSAGGTFSLALAADGSVWAWGWNDYGQLGTTGAASWKALRVPVVSGVSKVTAGWQFGMALTSNGEVWTWGDDRHGELGDGLPLQSRPTPKHVPVGYGMTDIAAGLYHALALRPGSVWAWGDNTYGQLGNATVAYSPTSVRVNRLTDNAYQIAAGSNHSLALDRDGSVWAWGGNSSGQLGNGVVDSNPHNVPVHLATTTTFPAPVTQISAGAAISLAVLSGGGLWIWGNNQYGTVDAGFPRDQ
jgi:alpha-tubulin suppressor-like RCC1 family protein